MKVIITEDIIRNALNESIDEFIINEGWFNDSMLGKVWNGVKNAAAMYMDNRTNGQWNNKYGIYANGNGKTTELYYLNKWFNTHLNNIKQIEYRNNTPSADFSRNREYVERNGERVYTDTEIQEKDVQTYVQKNITPQNFNSWIGNFIKDRQALKLIDDYILKCQKGVADLQTAMNLLNTGSFLADPNTGQVYIKTRNSELSGQRQEYYNKQQQEKQQLNKQQQQATLQQQQQMLDNAKRMINAWCKYIGGINAYKNGLIKTKTGSIHWTSSVLGALSKTNGMPNEIKQWLDSIIVYNVYDMPKNVAQKITYNDFINSNYGSNYKKMEEKLNSTQQQQP